MRTTQETFQQMVQERLEKVEEIKNGLKLSTVSKKKKKKRPKLIFNTITNSIPYYIYIYYIKVGRNVASQK